MGDGTNEMKLIVDIT